jgi:hypothetical protein
MISFQERHFFTFSSSTTRFFLHNSRGNTALIMATETFAILLLLVGIIIVYFALHKCQPGQRTSKGYTLSWTPTSSNKNTIFEDKRPFPPLVKPYVLPALRTRASSRMAMGLKRLDESNWLTYDDAYLPEHALRAHLLQNSRSNVLQCLPGTEAACHEVLDLVTFFLSKRFPEHFTINHSASVICNHLTKETYLIGSQCPNPMETAARLAMEDFNILVKDPQTGEYLLMASATLFPAGWQLQERIGTSMANLHAPVPGWQEKLGGAVNRYFPILGLTSNSILTGMNRYFDHLSPRTCVERYNLFIQTTTELFQDGPEAAPPSGLLLTPQHITVRRERQTFTRLEKSGAVLFTVRTYMQPLTDLSGEEVEGLLSQIRGWEGEMKTYKGWHHWGNLVESWCESQLAQGMK